MKNVSSKKGVSISPHQDKKYVLIYATFYTYVQHLSLSISRLMTNILCGMYWKRTMTNETIAEMGSGQILSINFCGFS